MDFLGIVLHLYTALMFIQRKPYDTVFFSIKRKICIVFLNFKVQCNFVGA